MENNPKWNVTTDRCSRDILSLILNRHVTTLHFLPPKQARLVLPAASRATRRPASPVSVRWAEPSFVSVGLLPSGSTSTRCSLYVPRLELHAVLLLGVGWRQRATTPHRSSPSSSSSSVTAGCGFYWICNWINISYRIHCGQDARYFRLCASVLC